MCPSAAQLPDSLAAEARLLKRAAWMDRPQKTAQLPVRSPACSRRSEVARTLFSSFGLVYTCCKVAKHEFEALVLGIGHSSRNLCRDLDNHYRIGSKDLFPKAKPRQLAAPCCRSPKPSRIRSRGRMYPYGKLAGLHIRRPHKARWRTAVVDQAHASALAFTLPN